jgi:hypothetical protein
MAILLQHKEKEEKKMREGRRCRGEKRKRRKKKKKQKKKKESNLVCLGLCYFGALFEFLLKWQFVSSVCKRGVLQMDLIQGFLKVNIYYFNERENLQSGPSVKHSFYKHHSQTDT